MNLFKQQTPTSIYPPGYLPDLDRDPPKGGRGCLQTITPFLLLIPIGGGLIWLILTMFSGASAAPVTTPTVTGTPAPTDMPTLTASPTMDYCWWLTPSPTYTLTPLPLAVTPDAWQATGTAIYLETGTATATHTPTQQPPRAWCDATPTFTPIPLATETPDARFSTMTAIYLATASITETPTGRATATSVILPTTTLFPTLPAPVPAQPIAPVQPISPTQLPAQPPAPIIIQTVIYALPSETPMPTNVPTETSTATATHTETATTPAIHTEVPTATATVTPTATATETPTMTATLLPTETPTFVPTPVPMLAIIASDCTPGYPVFSVMNIGGSSPLFAEWQIELFGIGIVASGVWYAPDLPPGGFAGAAAPNWINIPGTYMLTVRTSWDPVTPQLQMNVICNMPTPSATPTPTGTPTL
jgi:hypothetical protein